MKKAQERYEGQENQDGQKHGYGELRCPEYYYKGEWFNDKKHGNGKCVFKNRRVYEGQFFEDKYHGQGVLRYEYFGTYKGEFANGFKHGQGTEEFKNGSYYTGSFKYDKLDGKGVFTIPKINYSYEGEFKDGWKEGQGVETFANGSQYNGNFKKGLRHGMGKFFTTTGYTYTGEWQYGVKQGYGVEFNTPTDEKVREDLKEAFLYEGEFWSNLKNGIGKLMSPQGNYYYGGFRDGKKNGIGFSYLQEDSSYLINLWINGDRKEMLIPSFKIKPGYIDGYHKEIQEVHKLKHRYVDKEFDIDIYKNFLLSGKKGASEYRNSPENAQGLELSSIIPNLYFSHDIHQEEQMMARKKAMKKDISEFSELQTITMVSQLENTDPFNHPIPLYGQIYDQQVITFLIDLIKKKNHLKHLIHFYSTCPGNFFLVWMYMKDHGLLQKYPMAVDDQMIITEEGMNLFTQLENSSNCILTILEKVWNKYVYLNNLQDSLQGRYMEKILLAFLGAPCQSQKINESWKENDLEELKKIVMGTQKYNIELEEAQEKMDKVDEILAQKNQLFDSMRFDVDSKKKVVETSNFEETTQLSEDSEYWRYVYVYPRERNYREIKVDPNQPYTLKEIIHTSKNPEEAVFVLEAPGIKQNIGNLKSNTVESIMRQIKYSHYFIENGYNCHFCMDFEDFSMLFDEIVYSDYTLGKRYNYSTIIRDRPNSSFRFSESFVSFESYMNDNISISVYQDHILHKKIPVKQKSNERNEDGEEDISKKDAFKPVLLPMRILLGRKSLIKERQRTNPIHHKKVRADKNSLLEGIEKNAYDNKELEDYRNMMNKANLGERTTKPKKAVFFNEETKTEHLNKMLKKAQNNVNTFNINESKLATIKIKEDESISEEDKDSLMELNRKKPPKKKVKKKSPFDSDIEGLRISGSPIKYVCGKGQGNGPYLVVE